MRRQLRWVLSLAGGLSLLTAAMVTPQPAKATAGPGGGELALTGQVDFTDGFPCPLPSQDDPELCVAVLEEGSLTGTLGGVDADGVPWTMVLDTSTDTNPLDPPEIETSFTYVNELGGVVPMCAASFGAGTGSFDATGTSEASGMYHDGEAPTAIRGAAGEFAYNWRAFGTGMLFHVRALTIRVELDRDADGDGLNDWVTVLDYSETGSGLNGTGVFVPTDASQAATSCVTGDKSPLQARIEWDFALSAL